MKIWEIFEEIFSWKNKKGTESLDPWLQHTKSPIICRKDNFVKNPKAQFQRGPGAANLLLGSRYFPAE